MNRWKLIVIEGVDATGKTTLAKNLARLRNGVYYKTPWNVSPEIRQYYDLPSVSPLERFHFYLNACKDDIHHILEIQNSGKDVVCDRLLDSTIISHKILDPCIDTKSAEIINSSLQKIQILLIAPLEIIQQRLRDRGQITRFEGDICFLDKMQNTFLSSNFNYICNTWKYWVHETSRWIYDFFKKILKCQH